MKIKTATVILCFAMSVVFAGCASAVPSKLPKGNTYEPGLAPASDSEIDKKGKVGQMPRKVEKTDAEWKAELTPEQYSVARQKGTERAFTGKYYDSHAEGVYKCVCCGAELFSSEQKYDSGSGWPSFWAPHSKDNVGEETDNTHGMARTEVICTQCGAHLGHVFDDGPKPTNQRFCINSASLKLEEKK